MVSATDTSTTAGTMTAHSEYAHLQRGESYRLEDWLQDGADFDLDADLEYREALRRSSEFGR
jgi:hypothetical protein